jgi:hypothetical protein
MLQATAASQQQSAVIADIGWDLFVALVYLC